MENIFGLLFIQLISFMWENFHHRNNQNLHNYFIYSRKRKFQGKFNSISVYRNKPKGGKMRMLKRNEIRGYTYNVASISNTHC